MNRLMIFVLGFALVGCRATPTTPKPTPTPTTHPVASPMRIGEAMSLIDSRDDWHTFPPINIPRHPAEKYLKGLYIVLDPGHGGKDHNGKGPTGILEADMNLRVGLLLGRLLKDAGVNVTLTRSDDTFLELSDRAKIANELKREDGTIGADLFISLHHNSGGGKKTNHSGVWYHGQVDDAEPALDAAKLVAINLNKALRTDAEVTSPLFSDQLMYAGGFGVLRACNVPCFLCESSFYSNPEEELRLADAGYNLREAYAIYTGLCEWAQSGRPTQSSPSIALHDASFGIETTLTEGLPDWWGKDRTRILASSISVALDGKSIPHEFSAKSKQLTADVTLAPNTTGLLEIHFANFLGNHNWPQRFEVKVADDGKSATLRKLGTAPAKATTQSITRPATRPTTQ